MLEINDHPKFYISRYFISFAVLKDIVFVVLTQQNSYHQERAKAFKKDFYVQLKNISKVSSLKFHILFYSFIF